MINKILLSLVLVVGVSAPAYADIANNAKFQKVLSLATAGVAVDDGIKQVPKCFATPVGVGACLRMTLDFGTALMSISSALSANKTQVQASVNGIDDLDWDPDFEPPEGFTGNISELTQQQIEEGFRSTSIPEFGTVGELQSLAETNLDKLKEKGYTYNPQDNTVSGPDGKKTSAASIASGASGSGATLAADGDAKAKALIKKYKDHFGISGSGNGGFTNPGGGGSSYANNYDSDDYSDDYNSSMDSLLNGLKKKGKRKPASVKGLVKKLGNGDTIGVAGDNIFEMIARGYKHKIKTKQLIGN